MSAGHEVIGSACTGTFTQSGGTHTVSDNLTVGDLSGSGTYNLNDGQLSAYKEFVGYQGGAGTFTQDGGINTIIHNLEVGLHDDSTGTYNLNDGQLSATTEYLGSNDHTTGTFTQSGGTNTVSDNIYLAYSAGTAGTYNLNAGCVSADNEFVSGSASTYGGTGEFTQNGGSNTISATLYVAINTGKGTYNLNDGWLSANDEFIGRSAGQGTFTQNGGTNTVSNQLVIGYFSYKGSYILSGGLLAVGGEMRVGADYGGGTFTWTAGALDATSITVGALV